MKNRKYMNRIASFVTVISFAAATFVPADESASTASKPNVPERKSPQTIEQARRQAQILHTTVHASLRVVHDRYYREDEGLIIPASALSEVFRDIESQEGIKLRWLAVEGQVMNSDHVARDAFETEAVQALKSGMPFLEQTSDGVFRRAAPITLSNHCLKCHMPDRKSTKDRTAGLIIAIPTQQDSANGK
jgi:hypothetical protein